MKDLPKIFCSGGCRINRTPGKRIIIVLVFLFSFTEYVLAHEIHDVAKNGDLEKVKVLLKKDPKLVHAKDKHGRIPFYWVTRELHLQVIKYLIEKEGMSMPRIIRRSLPAKGTTISTGWMPKSLKT